MHSDSPVDGLYVPASQPKGYDVPLPQEWPAGHGPPVLSSTALLGDSAPLRQ